MIVYRHLFEALNYFPLAMQQPADSNVDRRILDHSHSHRFCRRMRSHYHLMRCSIAVEYCFAVAGIDCRGQLKKLDWFAEAAESEEQRKRKWIFESG